MIKVETVEVASTVGAVISYSDGTEVYFEQDQWDALMHHFEFVEGPFCKKVSKLGEFERVRGDKFLGERKPKKGVRDMLKIINDTYPNSEIVLSSCGEGYWLEFYGRETKAKPETKAKQSMSRAVKTEFSEIKVELEEIRKESIETDNRLQDLEEQVKDQDTRLFKLS